jgi:hypothetical protein
MSEPPREPSNAEILAALADQSVAIRSLAEALGTLSADVADTRGEMRRGFTEVRRDIGQLRADVVAVKADGAYTAAYVADLQEAHRRHGDDPDGHPRAA